MNVLAFTASRYRPDLLRSCCLQLQSQSHHTSHGIYINSESTEDTATDHRSLLQDLGTDTYHLKTDYGLSSTQHEHHMKALQLFNWEDFDIFLKIDDDDIYFKTYIEEIVKDFKENKWDFSGTRTQGLINGKRWLPKYHITHLGNTEKDDELNVKPMIASSYAFSKKAIKELLSYTEIKGWEDPIWRQRLTANPDIAIHVREHSNMAINIHGKNVSLANHYKP